MINVFWFVCNLLFVWFWWAVSIFFFFFNDTATTEIYTLSLHDALPIYRQDARQGRGHALLRPGRRQGGRSEEHTSELQSLRHLVCRLLLEKKKTIRNTREKGHKKRSKSGAKKDWGQI